MKIHKLDTMKGGWYVGNFTPTCFNSEDFEVCYKVHAKDEKWDHHYHKEGTEINLLIEGKMLIHNKELNSGDVFILEPYEIADPVFLEECKIVIVKTPSVPGDKYIVNG